MTESERGGRWPPATLIGLLYLAFWFVALILAPSEGDVREAIGNFGILPLLAVAAAFGARLAALRHLNVRARFGFALIALALVFDAIGFGAFGYHEVVLEIDPTFNWVNIPYYLFFGAMFYGFLMLTPPAKSATERPLYALDVAAIGLGGAMLLAQFVAHPILHQDNARSVREIVLLTAYPFLGAITLFGVASLMLRLPGGAERRPYLLLAGGMLLYLVADAAWAVLALLGEYVTGSVSDVLWMLGAFTFLAALELAWRAQRAPAFVPAAYESIAAVRLLPYLAASIGALTMLIGVLHEVRHLAPLAVLAAVLSGVVLWRQWLAERHARLAVAERSKLRAERRLAALVEHLADAIFLITPEARIVYASPGAGDRFQIPAEEGASLLARLHPADLVRARAALADLAAARVGDTTFDCRFARPEGGWRWCEISLADRRSDEDVSGVVVNLRDVTDRVEMTERLRHQSLNDPLTGLTNRGLFQDRLMQALRRRRRGVGSIAVLFVDLDHFKLINDSLGPLAGDHLIRVCGQRLADTVRGVDTVARFGGDEFAILLEDAGTEGEVIGVAGRVLQALALPFVVDGLSTRLQASVGVAFARPEDDADTVLRNADLAMYKAKTAGRGRVAVYEPELQESVGRRLALHDAVRRALHHGELELHYQPIYAADGGLNAIEALLRWPGGGLGEVDARHIVRAAEEAGLAQELAQFVLSRALTDAASLPATQRDTGFVLVVNLSSSDLADPDFILGLAALLARQRWPAARLMLDIEAGGRTPDAATLAQIRDLGVRLLRDDRQLAETIRSLLEPQRALALRLPREITARLADPKDESAHRVAQAVQGVAEILALPSLAQGVETAAAAEQASRLGYTLQQGFFLAEPLPLDALVRHLEGVRGGG